MVNSTNFSIPTQVSTGFGSVNTSSGVLLLETGDELLLENDTDSILLEGIETKSLNYTKPSVYSTNYAI